MCLSNGKYWSQDLSKSDDEYSWCLIDVSMYKLEVSLTNSLVSLNKNMTKQQILLTN